MKVLIAESRKPLSTLWKRHLERAGATVRVAETAKDALSKLDEGPVDVIVLNVMLDEATALTVADFAQYRQPLARVIYVTNSTFFSDGSIFRHSPNACAFLPSTTSPDDLTTMVEHYANLSAA